MTTRKTTSVADRLPEPLVAIAAADIDWLISVAGMITMAEPEQRELERIKAGGAMPMIAEPVEVSLVYRGNTDGSKGDLVGAWRDQRDAGLVLQGIQAAFATGTIETVTVR